MTGEEELGCMCCGGQRMVWCRMGKGMECVPLQGGCRVQVGRHNEGRAVRSLQQVCASQRFKTECCRERTCLALPNLCMGRCSGLIPCEAACHARAGGVAGGLRGGDDSV